MVSIDVAYNHLKSIVGSDNISRDEAILWGYSKDASLMDPVLPGMVLRPKNTEEVAKIVHYANENHLAVIPSGGRSSLCWAGVPLYGGELLLDLTRMNGLKIHENRLNVDVEAGCTFSKLAYELKQLNLTIGPPGPFTAFSATIGGGASVSAYSIYGANVYGIPNEYIVGLEVVLPNGSVIKTGAGANPQSKSVFRYCNGPDLTGLFLGSHGTLGIITKATFKLQKRHQKEVYLDYIFGSLEKITQCAIELTQTGFCGLIMQFPKMFYRQGGLDLRAQGGGLMINVFGNEQDIEYRTKIVEQIVAKYTDMKPEMLAPGFNARELAKYRHWCCVNGRWAEVTGYLSLDKVNGYMKLCQNYIDQNRSIIDDAALIPQYGVIYTQNCVNVFIIFLIYDVNDQAIKAAKTLAEQFSEKLFDFGVSPYWIGKEYSRAIFSRLDKNYVALYNTIKQVLDPNNILNPGMFGVK